MNIFLGCILQTKRASTIAKNPFIPLYSIISPTAPIIFHNATLGYFAGFQGLNVMELNPLKLNHWAHLLHDLDQTENHHCVSLFLSSYSQVRWPNAVDISCRHNISNYAHIMLLGQTRGYWSDLSPWSQNKVRVAKFTPLNDDRAPLAWGGGAKFTPLIMTEHP